MGTKLPRKLEQKMQIVGEQIKLARLRRNLSVAQVAERATCSPLTVSRIEKGTPTVAIGIYLRVLYALQLDDDILLLAKEDAMGKALQDLGHHRFCRREPLCPYCCTYNTKRYQGWPSRQRADRYFAQEEQPDIPLNCGRSGLLQQARRG